MVPVLFFFWARIFFVRNLARYDSWSQMSYTPSSDDVREGEEESGDEGHGEHGGGAGGRRNADFQQGCKCNRISHSMESH